MNNKTLFANAPSGEKCSKVPKQKHSCIGPNSVGQNTFKNVITTKAPKTTAIIILGYIQRNLTTHKPPETISHIHTSNASA